MQDTCILHQKHYHAHCDVISDEYITESRRRQYSFSSMFKFTTFCKEQCHSTIQRALVFECEKYLGTLWDVKCYYGNQIVRY